MTLSQAIAAHVTSASFEQLSHKTVQMTKFSLLDALGVTLGASGLGEGCNAFVQLAREANANPEATILGHGIRTSASLAAFANGAMAHALDFEDTHDGAPVHPNAQVIPAALALAESLPSIDGRALIAAVAVGCDLVCRLGLCLTKPIDEFGWYPPPILGAFGATVAAANLLKLDARQTLDAVSLTLCQVSCSAEIKHNPQSVMRSIRDAFAAQTAVISAQLARKGLRGFDQPFEGKAGLFNNFARGGYEPSILLKELGQRFEGENVSFKPWPACRGTHAYIDAALQLKQQHGFRTADIASGRMIGHRVQQMLYEPLAQKRQPTTAIDAKFSLPFTVATALAHGSVTLGSYVPQALANEEVLDLAKRLSFEVDPDYSASDNATRGTLILTMRDGQSFTLHVENPLGHSSRPMDEGALRNKFMQCSRFSVRQLANAEKLADTVMTLESCANLQRELFSLLI
jgi:2-methylcitrate dehydratase PrpD